jgi:hypothetical protein
MKKFRAKIAALDALAKEAFSQAEADKASNDGVDVMLDLGDYVFEKWNGTPALPVAFGLIGVLTEFMAVISKDEDDYRQRLKWAINALKDAPPRQEFIKRLDPS